MFIRPPLLALSKGNAKGEKQQLTFCYYVKFMETGGIWTPVLKEGLVQKTVSLCPASVPQVSRIGTQKKYSRYLTKGWG